MLKRAFLRVLFVSAASLLIVLGSARIAKAQIPSAEESPAPSPQPEERDRAKLRKRLRAATETASYFDLVATAMAGRGLRFNNPYRLPNELGSGGESLSSTAPYIDLAFMATTGNPNGLQHGGRLGWSVSLTGVPQQVVTPAYAAVYRAGPWWIFYGWAGLPLLAEPDFNVGTELGLGATWMARAGIGATAAAVADGFYGAGTRETTAAFYPVLSLQLGLLVSYEVLP